MRTALIAIVDDQPILLAALAEIFNRNEDFQVVATGSSAAEAIKIAASHPLDVLIIDPTTQGNVDAISMIKSKSPNIRIVALSPAIGADFAVRALEAGASGYVLKKSTARELEDAVGAVLRGETYISSSFASTVITALRDQYMRKKAAQFVELNTREQQIVRLLLGGKTNKEIASKLSISEKTVKHYMTDLMQKLNVRNRTQAVIAVQRMWPPSNIDLPIVRGELAAERSTTTLETK